MHFTTQSVYSSSRNGANGVVLKNLTLYGVRDFGALTDWTCNSGIRTPSNEYKENGALHFCE